MPQQCYFVTFIYFDAKHQRSNKFHHLSLAILSGEKAGNGTLSNLKLLDSYGYYSHRIPQNAQLSTFDRFLRFFANINFRLHDSYAELKQEDLINLDLGFGISGGPIVEITAQEKVNLETQIQLVQQKFNDFFANVDREASAQVADLNITDARLRERKLEEIQNSLREKHYLDAVKQVDQRIKDLNLNPELLIEETAHASGLISDLRYHQEKLKMVDGIELFEFSFNPQARTCKSMGIELVLAALAHDAAAGKRKMLLSQTLTGSYYTQAVPRLTKDLSKMIYHSVQPNYQAQQGKIPLPQRTWNDSGLNCQLIAHEHNTYFDINGEEQPIQHIENRERYFNHLENLVLLQRLLNDFTASTHNYSEYIKQIDQTINSFVTSANNCAQREIFYYDLCRTLKTNGCFDRICRDILKTEQSLDQISNFEKHLKQKNIKLEDGIRVEFNRLKNLYQDANETPQVSCSLRR